MKTYSRNSYPTDFNPRSPYGERPALFGLIFRVVNFNPRSPYGERQKLAVSVSTPKNFNPRSPYGERHPPIQLFLKKYLFQSTLPLRGATGGNSFDRLSRLFQSTLPLRGATLKLKIINTISLFQSTLPLRGATHFSVFPRSAF